MLIGVPKEIKDQEYRVGLTPNSVKEFIVQGHHVMIETKAGEGIGYSDQAYHTAGAKIVDSPKDIFSKSQLIIKVKEPLENERQSLQPGQILFTYLHLAPNYELTRDLVDSKAICIAYETVTDPHNHLPLLIPMSEVAGRLSIQAGAYCLERAHGGKGILLGGVPGVQPARVVVLGGGVVGSNAILIAIGMGADVTVIDNNVTILTKLANRFGPSLKTIYSTRNSLDEYVLNADLVIGAVLIPGTETPKLVSSDMVQHMKYGSVLVDVAIDQGGCCQTSHPTTHTHPTYILYDVVHYCVANMPGAVPKTSTHALNNATLPYALTLAKKGLTQALLENNGFLNGLNVYKGKVTYKAVAEKHHYTYHNPLTLLK